MKITRHLSYANLMSSLAVFLLLGGAGAWAANKHTKKIGTTQIKASAITTAKIKNSAVDGSKLKDGAVSNSKLGEGSVSGSKLTDGSVSTAKLQADAVTGEKVNEATLSEVPSANSANPLAFAKVGSEGVVDAANSKAITSPNVSHPATGVYCISLPAFSPRGGQVSPQAGGGAVSAQIAAGGTASCPGAVQVSTLSAAGAAVNGGFYVELYR